eukprot:570752-Rhodomonas_salina.1
MDRACTRRPNVVGAARCGIWGTPCGVFALTCGLWRDQGCAQERLRNGRLLPLRLHPQPGLAFVSVCCSEHGRGCLAVDWVGGLVG